MGLAPKEMLFFFYPCARNHALSATAFVFDHRQRQRTPGQGPHVDAVGLSAKFALQSDIIPIRRVSSRIVGVWTLRTIGAVPFEIPSPFAFSKGAGRERLDIRFWRGNGWSGGSRRWGRF